MTHHALQQDDPFSRYLWSNNIVSNASWWHLNKTEKDIMKGNSQALTLRFNATVINSKDISIEGQTLVFPMQGCNHYFMIL